MLLVDASPLDSLVGLWWCAGWVTAWRSWDFLMAAWSRHQYMAGGSLHANICTIGTLCDSAVSTSAGLKARTGLGGSSVMDAVELGVMGLVAEVPFWLASAVSSNCIGVTDTLLTRTASNTEKSEKSAGTSDSLSNFTSRTTSQLVHDLFVPVLQGLYFLSVLRYCSLVPSLR